MSLILIPLVAFLASVLTFFSGFGLGTLLTPVFMVFFPIDLAIGLTGVVHFCNNCFKLVLVGKNANAAVLIRFGIPAVISAVVGSLLLVLLSDVQAIFQYSLFGRSWEVFPVKLIIAVLLIVFALMDLIPRFKQLQFGKEKLPIGGALSGFFGGLSGHQGALRSAFLIRAGLSKEAFIGTAVVVSIFVDFTRLSVYASRFSEFGLMDNLLLVSCATAAAILGAFLGNQLLKKVTIGFIQNLVAVMLIALSLCLGMGFL